MISNELLQAIIEACTEVLATKPLTNERTIAEFRLNRKLASPEVVRQMAHELIDISEKLMDGTEGELPY